MTNVKVYIIADVYNLPALKDWAVKKYEAALKTEWDTASFCQSIDYLWENTLETDAKLRDVILQFVESDITVLINRADFKDLIKSNGEVAMSIITYLVKKHWKRAEKKDEN